MTALGVPGFFQVGDGNIDFVPSPAESQSLIASRYAVPSTLLIRFANDMLDETSSILPLLQKRMPSGVQTPPFTILLKSSVLSSLPNSQCKHVSCVDLAKAMQAQTWHFEACVMAFLSLNACRHPECGATRQSCDALRWQHRLAGRQTSHTPAHNKPCLLLML